MKDTTPIRKDRDGSRTQLMNDSAIIGGGLACGPAGPLGTLTDKTPWHVDGGNSRDVDDGFWHVGRHHRFGISTTTLLAYRRRQSSLACRRRIFFACRREQSFLHVDGDNLVWHVDGNNLFCMSTETILFGMSTGTFFCMSTETISFGMSTGAFFCMSTEAIFFACRRRQSCFGMSAGTTLWHVDGRFGMSTRRIPTLTLALRGKNQGPCDVCVRQSFKYDIIMSFEFA